MKLKEIERLIKNKLSPDERVGILAHRAGSVICALAKNLIKSSGYSIVSTVLTRELRNLGKRDARKYMELFKIEKGDLKNASNVLRIAAFLLGLKFDVKDDRAVILECPYGSCVKEFKEPFICNVCLEYCKGIVEEALGPEFTFKRSKWLIENDKSCSFLIQKRT